MACRGGGGKARPLGIKHNANGDRGGMSERGVEFLVNTYLPWASQRMGSRFSPPQPPLDMQRWGERRVLSHDGIRGSVHPRSTLIASATLDPDDHLRRPTLRRGVWKLKHNLDRYVGRVLGGGIARTFRYMYSIYY